MRQNNAAAPLVRVDGVNMNYHTPAGETPALKDISFSVMPGEFVAVVGPSGCGKSTILSLVAGLISPSSGEIYICNQPVNGKTNPLVGYMLQHDHLFEWRSIYGNVMLGLEIKRRKKTDGTSYVDELLKRYGLGEFKASRPSELSGGMRQRAALIRTLALEPEILLLDEPFSALDYQTRLTVCDDIYSIIKKEHKTAVLVTHDLSEAISVGDTVYVLSRRPGRIARSVSVDFPADLTPLMRRNAPEFKDYFNILWKELNENG